MIDSSRGLGCRSATALTGQNIASCHLPLRRLQHARDELTQRPHHQHAPRDLFIPDAGRATCTVPGVPTSPHTSPLSLWSAPPSPTTERSFASLRERGRLLGPEPTIHPTLARQNLVVAWVCDTWRTFHPLAKDARNGEILAYLLRLAQTARLLLEDFSAPERTLIEQSLGQMAAQTPCQPERVAQKFMDAGDAFLNDASAEPTARQSAAGLAAHLANLAFKPGATSFGDEKTPLHSSFTRHTISAVAAESKKVEALVEITHVFSGLTPPATRLALA